MSLALSVCPSVCLFVTNIASLFLFLDGIEPYLGHQFSMTKSKKNVFFDFYARQQQHMPCYIAYMPRQFRLSVRLSVCPSVKRVYYVETAERIIEILSPSDRPIILVFRHKGSSCNKGVTPTGAPNTRG